MNINKIVFPQVNDCDLDHIFQCGQAFRWEPCHLAREIAPADDLYDISKSKNHLQRYLGAANKHFALIEFNKKTKSLTITGTGSQEFWRNYLDLDRDYGEIKNTLIDEDDTISDAICFGSGIRILNQDLWEIIISFIISQNNHIPRIKGCIANLSKSFGRRLECYDEISLRNEIGVTERCIEQFIPYSLPTPEVLSQLTVDDLAPIRLGYRAKYLISAAKQVIDRGMPKCYEEIISLTGVGPKVANCISLFGLGERNSFPIDVWVKRVMNRVYGLPEDNVKVIAQFAEEKFGALGGYAQQYLFYYMRELSKK
ncbi:DNA-3-methyladenine glycosylase family protein [Eubacteriales bacterium KG127]